MVMQAVERAQRGDKAAQEELLEASRQRIFALAYHLVGSRAEAEEVAQEALLKIFLRLEDLREPERYWPWAVRLAGNLYRDFIKKRRVTTIPLEDLSHAPGREDPARSALVSDIRSRLNQALNRISPTLRVVLALRDIEGFTTEEVCEALSLPEGTVKSRLFEARRKMREELLRQGVTASLDLC